MFLPSQEPQVQQLGQRSYAANPDSVEMPHFISDELSNHSRVQECGAIPAVRIGFKGISNPNFQRRPLRGGSLGPNPSQVGPVLGNRSPKTWHGSNTTLQPYLANISSTHNNSCSPPTYSIDS